MKHLLFFFALYLGSNIVFAQTKDSIVQYRTLDASLTEKSKLTDDNKYYQYLPINMDLGDIAYFIYASRDYVVALGVRDSAGHTGLEEDDPMFFETIGSKVKLPFKAPARGPYYFIFSSKEPAKTGKFHVDMFYYNSRRNKVTSKSSFCDKLKYITANANTGFEFLKYEEKKGLINNYFTPTVYLVPGVESSIDHSSMDSYNCRWNSSANLDSLQTIFDDLESKISSCLTDHDKKVHTLETVSKFEKDDFVRKVEFSLPGKHEADLSAIHGLSKIKDRVTLQLDKGRPNKTTGIVKYTLGLSID